MGWFDGFPFKSKEQLEKERKEFEKRVFPLGLEQRDKALASMRGLVNPKLTNEEILFAFISAKDAYKTEDDPEDGIEKAKSKLSDQKRLKPEDISVIVALLKLDLEVESLESYPTEEQLRVAAVLED